MPKTYPTEDPLVSLFYELLRDGHIAPGVLEGMVRAEEEARAGHIDESGMSPIPLVVNLSNVPLAIYAQELVDRLMQWRPLQESLDEGERPYIVLRKTVGPAQRGL